LPAASRIFSRVAWSGAVPLTVTRLLVASKLMPRSGGASLSATM
jgi:hypothetical protein